MHIFHGLDIDIKMRERNVAELRRTKKPDDKTLIKEVDELVKKRHTLQEMCFTRRYKYGSYGKDPTPEPGPSAKRVKTTHSSNQEFIDTMATHTGMGMTNNMKAPSGLVGLGNAQIPGLRAPLSSIPGLRAPSSSVPTTIPGLNSRANGPSIPPGKILQTPLAPPPIVYPSPRPPHRFVEPLTTSPTISSDHFFGWDAVTRAPAGMNENMDDIPVESIEGLSDETTDFSAFVNDDFEDSFFD